MKRVICILVALVFSLVMATAALANPGGELPEQAKKGVTTEPAATDVDSTTAVEEEQNNNNKDKDKSLYPYEHKLKVNGQEVKFDVRPVIKDGRMLVPVRAIMNQFGATVEWDEATQTVTVTGAVYDPEKIIEFDLVNGTVTVNDEPATIDVPAQLNENRTIVPIRFLAEQFGKIVNFNEETGDVDIEDADDLDVEDEDQAIVKDKKDKNEDVENIETDEPEED